ncbi:hypothetical protein D3C85_806270 [compost metagenome]
MTLAGLRFNEVPQCFEQGVRFITHGVDKLRHGCELSFYAIWHHNRVSLAREVNPRAGLFNQIVLDRHQGYATDLVDTHSVDSRELGCLIRITFGHPVLTNAARNLETFFIRNAIAIFQLHLAHSNTLRRIERQRFTTGGCRWVAEHLTHIRTELVNEQTERLIPVRYSGNLTHELGHHTRLQRNILLAHFRFHLTAWR